MNRKQIDTSRVFSNSSFIFCTRRAEKITIDNIGGESVESKDHEKLLGLQVSSSLDWKTHIQHLCSTLKQRLGMLKRIQQRLPREELILVAEAIFNSRIRYGIPVFIGLGSLYKMKLVPFKSQFKLHKMT